MKTYKVPCPECGSVSKLTDLTSYSKTGLVHSLWCKKCHHAWENIYNYSHTEEISGEKSEGGLYDGCSKCKYEGVGCFGHKFYKGGVKILLGCGSCGHYYYHVFTFSHSNSRIILNCYDDAQDAWRKKKES